MKMSLKLAKEKVCHLHNERGHYLPDISLFNQICDILKIDVSELLKGEKIDNIDKKEVDDVTMRLVKISNDKIKKKSKKILVLSVVLLGLVLCGTMFMIKSYLTLKESLNRDEVGVNTIVDTPVRFPSKLATKKKEDGWIASFRMEYMRDDLEKPYYYSYDCENFKYEKLLGYHGVGMEVDSNGEMYTYNIDINHPRYMFNDEYDEDINHISKYFLEKKFNDTITIDDLTGLNLNKIDKKEVLELYNEAISSELVTRYGNYPKLQNSFLKISLTKNDYTWYIGYILNMGHIKHVHLELKVQDVYLSDKIQNKVANAKERDIYDNIKALEKEIIDNQKFAMSDELAKMEPFNFLDYEFAFIKEDELDY